MRLARQPGTRLLLAVAMLALLTASACRAEAHTTYFHGGSGALHRSAPGAVDTRLGAASVPYGAATLSAADPPTLSIHMRGATGAIFNTEVRAYRGAGSYADLAHVDVSVEGSGFRCDADCQNCTAVVDEADSVHVAGTLTCSPVYACPVESTATADGGRCPAALRTPADFAVTFRLEQPGKRPLDY